MADQEIRIEDWEIDPETQAECDASSANIVKLKPGPNGEEPPQDVALDHDWMHKQQEEFEVTSVKVGLVTTKRDGTPVQNPYLEAAVRFKMDTGGQFTKFYRFNQDRKSWNYFTKKDKGYIDALSKAAGIERPANLVLQLQSLDGVRAQGTLFQGCEERMKKDASSGKWTIPTGEYRQIQEFRSFRPIGG